MKKFLLSTFALLAMVSTAFADGLSVEKVYLSTTSESTDLPVFFSSDDKSSVSGLEFNIQLPAGVEFVTKSNGDPEYQVGTTFDATPQVNIVGGVLKVAMGSSNPIKGKHGMLIAFKIKRSTSFNADVDDVLTGAKIFNVSESKNGEVNLDDFAFDITVTDRVVLDENSPFEPTPTSQDKVKVLVKRTIKKNTWSTIYLPFVMTTEKVQTAFGNDVLLADFSGWSCDINGSDVNSINIDFTTQTSLKISRGTPYLIYVSKDISEFEVKDVTINNTENPVKKDNTSISIYDDDEEDYVYAKGTMTGNFVLHAMKAKELFLQDNTFYYSVAGQNIKGFRATFTFNSPLGAEYVISNTSSARAKLSINGQSIDEEDTGINSMILTAKTGKVYSVSGQYMGENVDLKSLPKGVYIVDGNKVVNK